MTSGDESPYVGRLLLVLPGVKETEETGAAIGRALRAGDVLALIGDLGAGKTTLTRAIVMALGVSSSDVNSPTFTLIQEYAGTLPIRHCDAYRLRNTDEFADLGLDELFGEDGVAIIEWADRVIGDLPRDHLRIELRAAAADVRVIMLMPTGRRSAALLSRIETSLPAGETSGQT